MSPDRGNHAAETGEIAISPGFAISPQTRCPQTGLDRRYRSAPARGHHHIRRVEAHAGIVTVRSHGRLERRPQRFAFCGIDVAEHKTRVSAIASSRSSRPHPMTGT